MPRSEVRLWRGHRRHGQCESRHRKGLWEGSNKQGEGIKGLSQPSGLHLSGAVWESWAEGTHPGEVLTRRSSAPILGTAVQPLFGDAKPLHVAFLVPHTESINRARDVRRAQKPFCDPCSALLSSPPRPSPCHRPAVTCLNFCSRLM